MNPNTNSKNVYKSILTKPSLQATKKPTSQTLKVATLTESEMTRIKDATLTTEEKLLRDEKKRFENAKMFAREKALEVKNQMREIDKRNKENSNFNEDDLESVNVPSERHEKLANYKAEAIDEVKRITSVANEARAIVVLNQQVQDKRNVRVQQFEEIKEIDNMLEDGRLRKVQEILDKEQQHREGEFKGRKVIIEQIKDNHLKRLKLANEQEEEAQMMLLQIKKMQDEEITQTLIKGQKKKETYGEIMQANHQAILFKQEQTLKEKLENEKIMNYLKEKAAKEEEQLKKMQEARDKREKEIALLREKQEKAMDRQLELDQLRAKRMVQKEDRAARQKVLEESENLRKQNYELNEARMAQAEENQRKLYEQALFDKAEFEKMLAAQQSAKERERLAIEEKENIVKQYREHLQGQMMLNQEKKVQVERDSKEEGRLIVKKVEQEKQTIRRKQKEKVDMLEQEKVEAKYTGKLRMTKFI